MTKETGGGWAADIVRVRAVQNPFLITYVRTAKKSRRSYVKKHVSETPVLAPAPLESRVLRMSRGRDNH